MMTGAVELITKTRHAAEIVTGDADLVFVARELQGRRGTHRGSPTRIAPVAALHRRHKRSGQAGGQVVVGADPFDLRPVPPGRGVIDASFNRSALPGCGSINHGTR